MDDYFENNNNSLGYLQSVGSYHLKFLKSDALD